MGVTHECDYPPRVRALPKVTRTLIPTDATSGEIDRLVRERLANTRALYSLDLPVLQSLRPDLIVTQALCNVCAVADEEVREAACVLPGRPPVLNLEPRTLEDVFRSIEEVAAAAGVEASGAEAVLRLRGRVANVVDRGKSAGDRPRTVLLEWLDPPFSCGHWSPELVRLAGGREMLGREGEPSRSLRWDEVVASRPEVLLVACCGYDVERTVADLPLLRSVAGWDGTPAVRNGRVHVVDGSAYFSRPGPRLVDSLEIAAHVLHPDLHPLPDSGCAAAYPVPGAREAPASRRGA